MFEAFFSSAGYFIAPYIVLIFFVLSLIIGESLFINNLLNLRRPKSKRKKGFLFARKDVGESELHYFFACKTAFVLLGVFISFGILVLIDFICVAIFYLDKTSLKWIFGVIFFFIVNYAIYDILKK